MFNTLGGALLLVLLWLLGSVIGIVMLRRKGHDIREMGSGVTGYGGGPFALAGPFLILLALWLPRKEPIAPLPERRTSTYQQKAPDSIFSDDD